MFFFIQPLQTQITMGGKEGNRCMWGWNVATKLFASHLMMHQLPSVPIGAIYKIILYEVMN